MSDSGGSCLADSRNEEVKHELRLLPVHQVRDDLARRGYRNGCREIPQGRFVRAGHAPS